MKILSSIQLGMDQMAVNRRRWILWLMLLGCQNTYGQDARFNLTNVNVNQAAAVLQDFTGQAVVLASDVAGSISLSSLKPLDRREAIVLFATAFRAQGLTLHSDGGEITVTRVNSFSSRATREKHRNIETRIFTLQHLGVAEVSPAVRALLSRQGEISAKNNNTLVVSDKYSELLKITQHLMTMDRAKELSSAQMVCARVLDAAGLLQRHFAASPNKTLLGAASDELWGRQLLVLIQTLENGVGCANDAHSATQVEKRPLAVSATELLNQNTALGALEDPPGGVQVSEGRIAIRQPGPNPKTTASLDDVTNRELGVALEGWRKAWSRRDVSAYLGFYASHFVSSSESNRDAWKKKRTAVLARSAEISVDIGDLKLTLSDATHATMVFTQTYRSSDYGDVMIKTLQWVRMEDRWLITQESVVKR